jgi:hypothetical protein
MNLINGNLVKTVIQFGKDMLGVDLEEKDVSNVIKTLTFSENIQLANALKSDDVEQFSDILEIVPTEQPVAEDGYGSVGTQGASASTIKAQGSQDAVAQRRANIAQQDANRDATAPARTVAGSNIKPTGTGASRQPSNPDPDDVQAAQNAQVASDAVQQAQQNAAEIERLKQLAMGRR